MSRHSGPIDGEREAASGRGSAAAATGDAPAPRLSLRGVRRKEQRAADRRREERSASPVGIARLGFRRGSNDVTIVDLTPHGALVESKLMPFIGERVEISFPACPAVRATVRWTRSGRFGIEFAERTELPLSVWSENAPGFSGRRAGEVEIPPPKPERPPRRSVVWQCELFWGNRSAPVRLGNISPDGAMVVGAARVAPGADVVLALKSAGTVFAKVQWCRGSQLGLKFEAPFDVRKLDPSKGTLQPRRPGQTVTPLYLRTETDPNSPWAARWDRLRPEDL